MNISELLKSTQWVNREYGPAYTFGYKPFGQIYLYNKKVQTKPGFSIIEVSMMISSKTDTVEKGNHKVMLTISGVKQQTMGMKRLADTIRNENPSMADKEDNELVIAALEGKPLKDRTVMSNQNGTYTVIEDNISKDSEILVWCSCSNYYWVWQYYNVENGVDIFGQSPARYTHRTKKGAEDFAKNRPMRNPGRHPGMCKHIMLLLALLMDTNSGPDSAGNTGSTNVLKEARSITRAFKANIKRFETKDRLTDAEFKNLMASWEEELKGRVAKTRGLAGDIVLAPKKQQTAHKMKHWEVIQQNMVGKRGKKR